MNEKPIDEMTDAELRQDLIDLCAEIGVQMVESDGGRKIDFKRDGESVDYYGFNDQRELYITAMYNLDQCREDGLKKIHDGETVWPNGQNSLREILRNEERFDLWQRRCL